MFQLEAGPCTSGEHRKMHILGTKAQIESAIDQIDEMLKMVSSLGESAHS